MTVRIGRVGAAVAPRLVDGLAALLVDAVAGGASVGFLAGLEPAAAAAWWAEVVTEVEAGRSVLVAALDGQTVAGSVLLRLAPMANAAHRAEVAKLLVLRSHRRRGLARLLLLAVEEEARVAGRLLLLLDTLTGGPAERLFHDAGYTPLAPIPDYARRPDGELAPTTVMWKRLGPS